MALTTEQRRRATLQAFVRHGYVWYNPRFTPHRITFLSTLDWDYVATRWWRHSTVSHRTAAAFMYRICEWYAENPRT